MEVRIMQPLNFLTLYSSNLNELKKPLLRRNLPRKPKTGRKGVGRREREQARKEMFYLQTGLENTTQVPKE